MSDCSATDQVNEHADRYTVVLITWYESGPAESGLDSVQSGSCGLDSVRSSSPVLVAILGAFSMDFDVIVGVILVFFL